MRTSRTRASASALASILAAGSLFVGLSGGIAGAQGWLSGMSAGVRPADRGIRAVSLERTRPARSYYRGARTINLGSLVDQTGTNTHAHWQSRLNQDARSVGAPPAINPDADGDGFSDPFDRWPRDPSRW